MFAWWMKNKDSHVFDLGLIVVSHLHPHIDVLSWCPRHTLLNNLHSLKAWVWSIARDVASFGEQMQGSYIFPGISATRTKQRARVRDVCGQKNGAEHKSLGPFVRGASHFPEGSRRETSRRPSHDDVRHRYRGACRSSTWKHISRHILSGDVTL